MYRALTSSDLAKNKSCQVAWRCYCLGPLLGTPNHRQKLPRRVNGHKFLRRVGAGGHHNTEINPVFRGMVRCAKAAAGF